MIRTLSLVALAGFLVSVVTLSAAFFITGPANVMNGAWSFSSHGWGPAHWNYQGRDWGRGRWSGGHLDDEGPATTREIAWSGSDALTFDVGAEVHYTQAPGPAKLSVSGPKNAVDDLEMVNGRVRYTDDRDHDAHLVITVSAPSVTAFSMEGSGGLALENYKQDHLDITVSGDTDVQAKGETSATNLNVSGSGTIDLSGLKTKAAKVDIDGSGDAKLSPSEEANIDISGSGDVTLLSNPPKLHTSISGSGHVLQNGRDVAG